MFREVGQLAGMLRQLPRIKEEMERLQQRIAQLTSEGDAGGGMVRVRVNGKMEVVSCTLSDEAMQLADREMLEDLIKAACNQALERVRQQIAEETGKMTTGFGIPPDMGVPGLPGAGAGGELV
jgi:DNA-binding YbaB/EbfC family protein